MEAVKQGSATIAIRSKTHALLLGLKVNIKEKSDCSDLQEN
jgi:hypothetical protein